MYNPRAISKFEYLEFHNVDSNSVDVSGYVITGDIGFTFPSGSNIPANAYFVVANARNEFLRAYPDVTPSLVFGNYSSNLPSGNGKIALSTASSQQVLSFTYQGSWFSLATGVGSSIEAICDTATNFSSKSSWRSGLLPISSDSHLEFAGTPGSRSSWVSCPFPTIGSYISAPVFISEVYYHPSQDNRTQSHEFIEIYNSGSNPVTLDNWRIVSASSKASAFHYIVPKGTTISPQQYLVIAKDPTILSSSYSLTSSVIGGYIGELKDEGDDIILVDSNGYSADEIKYVNEFPWPEGINAKGLSLQRMSFSIKADKLYNWIASSPTPATANPSSKEVPDPVVVDYEVVYASSTTGKASVSTTLNVTLSSGSNTVTGVNLIYYLDDINRQNILATTVAMTGSKNDWSIVFPNGFAESTIFRFQISAQFGGSTSYSKILPRSSDSKTQEAFFVEPFASTGTESYSLFITNANLELLYDYASAGLYIDSDCCNLNANYNLEVPAILGHKNAVYDVRAKYQAAEFDDDNDGTGNLTNFQNPPSKPSPFRQMSWKVSLPPGITVNGRSDALTLLKPQNYGTNFVSSAILYPMFKDFGMLTFDVQFSRLYLNGQYYAYVNDLSTYTDKTIQDYLDDVNDVEACQNQQSEVVGFAYKPIATPCSGPVGPGDESFLDSITCNGKTYSTLSRISSTYPMATHKSWNMWDNVVNLTSALAGKTGVTFEEGSASGRKYFMDNFDVDQLLTYLAIVNFAGKTNEVFGIHVIYQRITDGKWQLGPVVSGTFFGYTDECSDPTECPLFIGEQGVDDNYNVLKDHFYKCFRSEYESRLLYVSQYFSSSISDILTKVMGEINTQDFSAPSGEQFDSEAYDEISSWVEERSTYISQELSTSTATVPNTCLTKPTITPQQTLKIFQGAPGTPQAPAITSASVSGQAVKLGVQWYFPNGNNGGVTSFTLERLYPTTSSFQQVYSGAEPIYTDSINGAILGSTVTYRVKASNGNGDSGYSNYATYTLNQTGAANTGSASSETSGASSSFNFIVGTLIITISFL